MQVKRENSGLVSSLLSEDGLFKNNPNRKSWLRTRGNNRSTSRRISSLPSLFAVRDTGACFQIFEFRHE